MKATMIEAAEAVRQLREFIGKAQMKVLGDMCRGEERKWFQSRLCELAEIIRQMPSSYETDGQGDRVVAHLHYFTAGWDFYLTEKDSNLGQHQAFGLVTGFEPELGYISLPEILAVGAEIDLYWQPKPVGEIRAGMIVS